jgi:hypothetical protein
MSEAEGYQTFKLDSLWPPYRAPVTRLNPLEALSGSRERDIYEDQHGRVRSPTEADPEQDLHEYLAHKKAPPPRNLQQSLSEIRTTPHRLSPPPSPLRPLSLTRQKGAPGTLLRHSQHVLVERIAWQLCQDDDLRTAWMHAASDASEL